MWQHEKKEGKGAGGQPGNAGNKSDHPGNAGKKSLRSYRWFLKMEHVDPQSSQRNYISRQPNA